MSKLLSLLNSSVQPGMGHASRMCSKWIHLCSWDRKSLKWREETRNTEYCTVPVLRIWKTVLRIQIRYLFRPPGSGYVSQRYGSNSGFYCHYAKIFLKKPCFLLFCDFLYAFLSLKNGKNVPSKSKKRKKFFFAFLMVTDNNSMILGRIGIRYSEERIRGSGSVQKY